MTTTVTRKAEKRESMLSHAGTTCEFDQIDSPGCYVDPAEAFENTTPIQGDKN